jgi:hypothetical protein
MTICAVVGFGEDLPPQVYPFPALGGGYAAECGKRKILEGIRPPNLPLGPRLRKSCIKEGE